MTHLMKNHFLKILFILFVLNASCERNSTNSTLNNFVEIEFPVGNKAVYASATYFSKNDSLSLQFLQIFSIQFDSTLTANDTVYYKGKVEKFIPDTFLVHPLLNKTVSIGLASNLESGDIIISMDKKWVLYQKSDIMDSYNVFMKVSSNDSIQTDTTKIPTEFYNQLPVYPKKIKPKTEYSIYRPGNNDDFMAVQRDFFVNDFTSWVDLYGENTGLFFSTKHYLLDLEPFIFKGIIDTEGIVISQLSNEIVITTIENPEGVDTVDFHQINRRIIDYKNQESLNSLSWYADYVLENGLSIIESE